MIEKAVLLELIAAAEKRQKDAQRQLHALDAAVHAHNAAYAAANNEIEALTKLCDLWHPEPPPDVPF